MNTWKSALTIRFLIPSLMFSVSPGPSRAEEPMPTVLTQPVTPPILTLTHYSDSTGASVSVTGQPGSEFLIERSSDLQSWLPAGLVTLDRDGVGAIADVSAAAAPLRLYRAISTSVPPLYSVNAVGFVNLTLRPGWQLIANPLVAADNTLPALFSKLLDGVSALKWDAAQQRFVSHDHLEDWPDPAVTLLPGEGCLFHNPFGTNLVQTFLGDLCNSPLVPMLPSGFSLQSVPRPYQGPLTAPYGFLPAPRIPVQDGDEIFLWATGSQLYLEYMFVGGLGWVSIPEVDLVEPQVNMAESFFYFNPGPPRWPIFEPGPLRQSLLDAPTGDGLASRSPQAAAAPLQVSSMSSASVNLFTFHADPLHGRVFDADGITPLSSGFKAQLYHATNDSESSLAAVDVPVRFLSGSGAGYLRGGLIQVPAPPATRVYLQLRVWAEADGETYEAALGAAGKTGQSPVFALNLAGGIAPPPFANGFRSFNLDGTLHPQLRFGDGPGSLVLSNGVFRLQLTGRNGPSPVVIEASSDLRTWEQVWVEGPGTDPIEFAEPAPPGVRCRFYRAREPGSGGAP